MAHMNQEKKKIIKANLDKVLKPLGIKYSLRVKDYMSINCTILSGCVDFVGNFKEVTKDQFSHHRDYVQVNPYWYQEHFTGEAQSVIKQVIEALKSAGYYDRSDAMIDYFDTAYYMHLDIGSWDKPYQYTKPTKEVSVEEFFADVFKGSESEQFIKDHFQFITVKG